jgi:hypothetical protein
MRLAITILAALLTTATFAQGRYYGPFTDAEAQLLSAVWSEIRVADDYEDINWPAYVIARAPGSAEVRRAMAANWDELRRAQRFEQINWDRLVRGDQRASRSNQIDRFEERFPGPFTDVGPFTRDEAALLSRLWPEIREAAQFEHIDWNAYGLQRAPGGADAREIMAAHWNEVRREPRFEDIDWDRIVDDRELTSSRRYAGGFGGGSGSTGPFTEFEAGLMSQVWGEIRQAARYEDIDWRAVGLSGPPGDRTARRIIASNWGALRRAERFEEIDWGPATGRSRRVLR